MSPSDEPAAPRAHFPIVGVGASAGGLEAFTQLLRALPTDTGMGFVLVQHLDRAHESHLTQLLSRVTSLSVSEITHNEPVLPNHVHVIPPDTTLSIVAGVLKLEPRAHTLHRPIDVFFESLAQDQRERAIGIVLSGTASDGTLGLEAIKAEGGITFAQDDSAKQDSMPRSAIAAGCVDLVLAPEAMAHELVRIAKHPYITARSLGGSSADPNAAGEVARATATSQQWEGHALPSGGQGTPRVEAAVARAEADDAPASSREAAGDAQGYARILRLLHDHARVDFSLYKCTTIRRRIARRLLLSRQDTLEAYAAFLRGNPSELEALYSDVLISVTSFFRNPETFDVLAQRVLPDLLAQDGDEPLRVWVLGCSTGQEAYSIAMAFSEAVDKAPRRRALQVFATDLNEALLGKARSGLYAKTLSDELSPERLRRFFVEEQGGYRVSKALRDMVVFARQNLIADPPFSRMDLISCRNLLIYLEPSLQKKAMPTFHYALKPGGFLLLGASESVGAFTELFEPLDRKHKIYVKKPTPLRSPSLPVRSSGAGARPDYRTTQDGSGELAEGARGELSAQREADRVTMTQFAPPAVLIDAELQVLQFRGATGAFLQPPVGKATFDVLKMAREGLLLPLRGLIEQARMDGKPARREGVRLEREGQDHTVSLQVIPLKNLRETCFLIVFEDPELHARYAPLAAPQLVPQLSQDDAVRRATELELELQETREYLQAVQQQHEAAAADLQAAHEEVQSANEELQSINEELETSKEELESANEELTTVNEEMSTRNVELNGLNNDLINLQTSTKLAIVLLGRDLTVRRFSTQAEKQFDLLPADIGRPISRIRHGLRTGDAAVPEAGQLDLETLVSDVIADVREQEHEVRDRAGRWYSLRVRPYFTLDNRVDGAVMVLVDIDELKKAEAASLQLAANLRASEEQLRRHSAELASAADRREEFLAMLGHELRNPLTAIARGLDLIGKKPAEEARTEELRTMMVRQAERIGTLLDQLLDIARVVSDKVELAQDRVDLNDVLHAAIETVTPILERQKHELVLELPARGPWVQGDAVRLTQVVENLLTNAAKYTPDGGKIILSLETRDEQARVIVRDSGVGLSADFLPHVFEVFTQSPRSLDRSQGGLGLGLPLARRLVEMHGGKLEAASEGPNRGSEFVVTLPPLQEQRPEPIRQRKPVRREPIKAPPRRILLVDDEIAIADVLAELLADDGHQTLAVNSGDAALDALSSFRPEVVLLDLGLPEVDGFEVARRLRAAHGGKDVLLVAVSGYQPGSTSLKEAGFDQHLVKPPNMRELAGLLAKWPGGKASKDDRV